MATLHYNQLPSPTWNWLKLNGASLSVEETFHPKEGQPELEGAYDTVSELPAPVEGSAGAGFLEFVTGVCPAASIVSTLPGKSLLVREDLSAAGGNIAGRLDLVAREGSHLVLIQRFQPEETASTLADAVSVYAMEGARVSVVQIVDGGQSRILSSLGILAEPNAQVEVTQIVLSGALTGIGGNVTLKGDRSQLDASIAYLCEKDHLLDINWVIPQLGKKTESKITANGVLRDTAKKIFRGTIDFHRGSAGSTGAENEDVLLLSETVSNQTLPVILCKEEDVAGSHGASIGKLSDELLYYMGSRGLDEAEIYRVLSRARLASGIRRIPDEGTREWLERKLGEESA